MKSKTSIPTTRTTTIPIVSKASFFYLWKAGKKHVQKNGVYYHSFGIFPLEFAF